MSLAAGLMEYDDKRIRRFFLDPRSLFKKAKRSPSSVWTPHFSFQTVIAGYLVWRLQNSLYLEATMAGHIISACEGKTTPSSAHSPCVSRLDCHCG
jgi:hypothetical protein